MCGIAGVLSGRHRDPVSRDRLEAMAAMLGHRGPDGSGLYRDAHVGLAHTRLSIIDLATGDQPLSNEDGTIWLSFNGEVFNYVELRRELIAQGHRFATRGDAEVVVHAYEQHGERAWERLNGQFAFALWDSRVQRLWLVRDRLGILPLHYTGRAGGHLVFASEVKAIFASGLAYAQPSPRGLEQVFTHWSVPAPDTVFGDVHAVRPGTALCIGTDLEAREQRWWTPDMTTDPAVAGLSPEDAADALGDRLADAVRLRLRSDVPVGAYLSGGLDSSVIASMVEQGEAPLETFAVRFEDAAFDETAEQRRMAGLLGTRHHELVCGPGEIAGALSEVVWHCETPLLRTAPVPLFLLSGMVRDSGMKVVLTGEGADELLAGYSIFKEDAIRRFWARRPGSGMRSALLRRVHPEVAASGARDTQLWQRFFGRELTATDDPFYSHRIRWQNTSWAQRLLSPDLLSAARQDASGGAHLVLATDARLQKQLAMPSGWLDWTPLARAQWLEIATFMSPYLLSSQGDRVAMAHGVEVRYPFLDPEVVRWSLRLPTRLKMPGLRDKAVLRRLAARSLPAEIWQRPKQPYRAPTTTALFGPNAPEEVRDLLSEPMVIKLGLLDPQATRRLVERAVARQGRMAGEREEMALVGALTLQMWGHHFF